jgi:hypothetical protein
MSGKRRIGSTRPTRTAGSASPRKTTSRSGSALINGTYSEPTRVLLDRPSYELADDASMDCTDHGIVHAGGLVTTSDTQIPPIESPEARESPPESPVPTVQYPTLVQRCRAPLARAEQRRATPSPPPGRIRAPTMASAELPRDFPPGWSLAVTALSRAQRRNHADPGSRR